MMSKNDDHPQARSTWGFSFQADNLGSGPEVPERSALWEENMNLFIVSANTRAPQSFAVELQKAMENHRPLSGTDAEVTMYTTEDADSTVYRPRQLHAPRRLSTFRDLFAG